MVFIIVNVILVLIILAMILSKRIPLKIKGLIIALIGIADAWGHLTVLSIRFSVDGLPLTSIIIAIIGAYMFLEGFKQEIIAGVRDPAPSQNKNEEHNE